MIDWLLNYNLNKTFYGKTNLNKRFINVKEENIRQIDSDDVFLENVRKKRYSADALQKNSLFVSKEYLDRYHFKNIKT